MRKTTIVSRATFAAAAAWIVSAAPAATVAAEAATPEARFAAADLNEDGVLTGKERQSGAPYDDVDVDGVVSRDEFVGRRNEEIRLLTAVEASRETDETFRRSDLTEDGILSGKERAGVEAYDADADGRITLAEFRTGRTARPGGLMRVFGLGGIGRGPAPAGSALELTVGGRATDGPKPVADPPSAPPSEKDRELFRKLDGNEDERLTGTEMFGSEDFDADRNGRVVLEEFLVGIERLRVAHAAQAKLQTTPPDSLRPDAAATPASEITQAFDAGKLYLRLFSASSHTGHSLRCATPDMQRIESTIAPFALSDQVAGRIWTDPGDPKRLPTKALVEAALVLEATVATTKDFGFFAFSGYVLTSGGETYLCPSEFDPRRPGETGVSLNDVARRLGTFSAGHSLLMLDLHPYDSATTVDGVEAAAERAFGYAPNLITLLSCVTIDPDAASGPFAAAAAEALAGGADFNRDEVVDHDEWLVYHRIAMPFAARSAGAAEVRLPSRIVGSGIAGKFGVMRTKPRPKAPVVAGAGPADGATPAAKSPPPGDLANSLGMSFKYLPPTRITCGSSATEAGHRLDELLKEVILRKGFYIATHEVTQAQFARVMGRNPSHFQGAGATDRLPVEQVTWTEAKEFCERLSRSPVEYVAGRTYRLPTECEWEYACCGKNKTDPFYCGPTITSEVANIRGDRPYSGSPLSHALGRTATVGSYPPNPYGLHDMHGNVAEWCHDWYARDRFYFFTKADQLYDYTGPLEGERRVGRGGDFECEVAECRTSARRSFDPDYRFYGLGFRVVCDVK